MHRIYPILILFLFATATAAFAEDADIARLFNEKHIRGTMIISSLDGTSTYSHNDARAATRMLPASTFKIANTLIALEEGVIADEKQVLKWDGKKRDIPAWNRDQTLESAFKSSCVWFYQELARNVGKERYTTWLAKLNYGNAQAKPEVDTFWLNGDLRISAVEQMAFLKQLYLREFPVKEASYELLRKIMVIEQTPAYTLRAKTGMIGFGSKVSPQTGWFVGYVESGNKVWLFAMNMDINNPAEIRFRQDLTMAALRLKGILK